MHGNRYYDNVNYDDDDDSYALDDNFFDYTTGIDGYVMITMMSIMMTTAMMMIPLLVVTKTVPPTILT